MLAGGHFCNKAEKNYSPIEGEANALARGLQDTKYYTMGCQNLYVATDHTSLVTVLGYQSLADVENPRLARIKERTLWGHSRSSTLLGNYNWQQTLYRGERANLYRLSATDIAVVEEVIIDDLQLRLTDLNDCSAKIHSVVGGDTVFWQ